MTFDFLELTNPDLQTRQYEQSTWHHHPHPFPSQRPHTPHRLLAHPNCVCVVTQATRLNHGGGQQDASMMESIKFDIVSTQSITKKMMVKKAKRWCPHRSSHLNDSMTVEKEGHTVVSPPELPSYCSLTTCWIRCLHDGKHRIFNCIHTN